MERALVEFLGSHGYPALVAVGFAEYAGAPVASVPLLLLAGGLSQQADLDPVAAVLSVALGGLVADLSWYLLIRWRGDELLDAACGLTSNRSACVLGVQERVGKLGPAYIVPAKFIPGAANLVGAGAALAGMRPARFVTSDAVALLLWAGAWTAVGRVFAAQVHLVLGLVAGYQRMAVVLAGALVAAAAAWRYVRVSRHRRAHRPGPGPGAPSGSDI